MTSRVPKPLMVFALAGLLLSFSAPRLYAQSDLGLAGSLEANHQTHFYKDPTKAFLLAFFPGFLIHGYGHFYAEDNLMGATLLTGEVLSLASIGTGLIIKSDTSTFSGGILGSPANADQAGSDMIIGGCILFAVTWVADMAHAPTSAEDYNHEFNLEPVASLSGHRVDLALAC
ncbi:MAG TPA: hypothetical protein VFR02_01000, partial [bacterium]|nr:hypothetical protein [bacterium]